MCQKKYFQTHKSRMILRIPAKTFLLGEYVALTGGPAMILTTSPCFEVSAGVSTDQAIHPASVAGRFWQRFGGQEALRWFDPYDGIGGLGASSAEFLGAYALATSETDWSIPRLLDAYWAHSALANQGMRPSGYDVLAQAQKGCVYLNISQSQNAVYGWPFETLDFVLLHTGKKLKTHEHLQSLALQDVARALTPMVDLGKKAFETQSDALLVDAVNRYYQGLLDFDLVAAHTKEAIESLSKNPDVLAAKGCGALGADVLLLLVPKTRLEAAKQSFLAEGFRFLASLENLYAQSAFNLLTF